MQFQQIDSLNTKASILLGVVGVILAALFSLWPHLQEFAIQSPSARWGLLAALVLLAVSAFTGSRAYSVQTYDTVPNPLRLADKYVTWEPVNIRYTLLWMLGDAFVTNSNRIKDKIVWLRITFWLIIASILVLASLLGYNLVGDP